MIRNPIPEGTFAAGTAAAAAAVGALPVGEGCAPGKPWSHRNAALDEVVDEEQNARETEVEKLPSGFSAVDVGETLLGSAKNTFLGEEATGGWQILTDACEVEELASPDGHGKGGIWDVR